MSKQIKEQIEKSRNRIKRLRNKYGLAATIAGVVTGGGYYLLSHSEDKPEEKIEVVNNDKVEMTPEEECDAYTASLTILTEGLSLEAYPDCIGVWTYGSGSTIKIDGTPVKKGDVLSSNEEAIDVAKHHMDNRVDYIFDYITRDLSPQKKAALRSFAYNCGAGIFVKDGELTELGKAVNEGNDDFVVNKMLEYNKAKGSFLTGLFSRRVFEAMIYQEHISLEDLQKCVIGGIGNISYNPEFRKLFNLETKKIFRGRRKSKRAKCKILGSYSAEAISDINVARKLVEICQSPIKIKLSKTMENLNTGKNVYEFIPEHLLAENIKNDQKKSILNHIPNLFDLCNEMKSKQTGKI